MRFSIGQKVVCIAPHPEWSSDDHLPRVGGIYTVRGYDDTDGLLVDEIVNGETCIDTTGNWVGPGEVSFWPDRFRPVVARKTDISIFQRMLDRTNAQ